MLARQKAIQNRRQYLKPGVQPLEHTNSVSPNLLIHSDNKVKKNYYHIYSFDLKKTLSI